MTKQGKAYQTIVEKLIRLIQEDNLKQGDRLPPERQLAETFKVSRHPVREAIRILEEQGVLNSRTGSGTFVVNAEGGLLDDLLIRTLKQDKSKLAEIFQFRRMLEPQIAAQAALEASGRNIDELTSIVKRQKGATGYQCRDGLDQAFHIVLARATRNGTLLRVVERLTDILSESRGIGSLNDDRWALSIAGHTHILRAVSSGDSKAAMKAMEQHLYQVEAAAKKGEPKQ